MVETGIRPTVLAVSVVLASAAVGLGLAAAPSARTSPASVAVRAAATSSGVRGWLNRSVWTGAVAGSRGSNSPLPASTPAGATASPATAASTPSAAAPSASVSAAASSSDPAVVARTVAPPSTTAVAPATTSTSTPTGPTVATLVAEVEATGIQPGANWSWSLGDTAARCGAIPGNIGTGCTFGAAGAARTVFSGSPSLALVAHEMANAETENDAVPSVVGEVATAEAGTAWSPIDAVASCLVEHYMGFQDHAAGTWECPATLAANVAGHIHD